MQHKDVETPNNHPPHISTAEQQSWGAFMAIVLILAMIIVGAYYTYSKRIATRQTAPGAQAASATSTTP